MAGKRTSKAPRPAKRPPRSTSLAGASAAAIAAVCLGVFGVYYRSTIKSEARPAALQERPPPIEPADKPPVEEAANARPVAPTPNPNCTDKAPECSGWARIGECDVNPGFMLVHCASSCDKCEMLDYRKRCAIDETVPLSVPPGEMDATFRHASSGRFASLEPVVLSSDPWVLQFDNFVSDDEAEAFIQGARSKGWALSEDAGEMRADGSSHCLLKRPPWGRRASSPWPVPIGASLAVGGPPYSRGVGGRPGLLLLLLPETRGRRQGASTNVGCRALSMKVRADPLVAPHIDDGVVRHQGVPGGRAHPARHGARRERDARAASQLGVRAGALRVHAAWRACGVHAACMRRACGVHAACIPPVAGAAVPGGSLLIHIARRCSVMCASTPTAHHAYTTINMHAGAAVRGGTVLRWPPRLHPRARKAAVRPACVHSLHVPIRRGGEVAGFKRPFTSMAAGRPPSAWLLCRLRARRNTRERGPRSLSPP